VHSGISEIGKFRLEKELIKVGPLLFKVLALKIDVQRALLGLRVAISNHSL